MRVHHSCETKNLRLHEIVEEISRLNSYISDQMHRLDHEPRLVTEITALMARCGALVSEAAELRA